MLLSVAWADDENNDVMVDTTLLTVELLDDDDDDEEPDRALLTELRIDDWASAATGAMSIRPINAILMMFFFIVFIVFCFLYQVQSYHYKVKRQKKIDQN